MFEITGVKMDLCNDPASKLLAYADIELDNCLVIHGLRIINNSGELYVAMPSRRITDHCFRCRGKNARVARWCNWCGADMGTHDNEQEMPGRLFFDVVHPINSDCRSRICGAVLAAYKREVDASHSSGAPGELLPSWPSAGAGLRPASG